MITLAINGFGRIGRHAFKIAHESPEIEVVAVNDLTNARELANMLIYDSVYGEYASSVQVEEDGHVIDFDDDTQPIEYEPDNQPTEVYLVVDDKRVRVFAEKDPTQLPWKALGVDVVLECTGRFTKDGTAKAHIQAGARRVVVSAPTKGGDIRTYLKGVNHDAYAGDEIISNASCTTNCSSPVAAVMESAFGIEKAMLTTIHAYTSTQNIVDGVGQHDMRRNRAAAVNMIPTSTGAAVSTTEVIPSLQNKFDGIAIRVPVITGSLTDFTFLLKQDVTIDEVNEAFLNASENPYYEDVLAITYAPIVSTDIIGSSFSAIVDLSMTRVVGGNLVKVLAWYDNEWGYSNRLVEMALQVAKE